MILVWLQYWISFTRIVYRSVSVSDNLLTGEALSTTERQTSFTQMITLALEVAVDMAARRA